MNSVAQPGKVWQHVKNEHLQVAGPAYLCLLFKAFHSDWFIRKQLVISADPSLINIPILLGFRLSPEAESLMRILYLNQQLTDAWNIFMLTHRL